VSTAAPSDPIAVTAVGSRYKLGEPVYGDLEVYPGRWVFGFKARRRDGTDKYFSAETPDKLREILEWIGREGRTLYTYNGAHYDLIVARAILAGLDPYEFSTMVDRGSAIVRRSSPARTRRADWLRPRRPVGAIPEADVVLSARPEGSRGEPG
jgi:hypothetical protein